MNVRELLGTKKGKAISAVVMLTLVTTGVGQHVVGRESIKNVEKVINNLDEASQRDLILKGLDGDITFSINGVDEQDRKAMNNYLNTYGDDATAIKKITTLEKANPKAKIEIEKIKLKKGLLDLGLEKFRNLINR